jgi:flagellar motility protein MotE (MotC chaperone)
MIRQLRDVRLIPVVLIAAISLFALKTIGLVLNGHYALDDVRTAGDDISGSILGAPSPARGAAPPKTQSNKQSWAQEMFNYPDVTGGAGDEKPAEKPTTLPKTNRAGTKPAEPKPASGGVPVPLDGSRSLSAAELAILERLQERRSELDERTKELDMRENLVKAAEKRLEGRIDELKDLEARVNNMMQQRDESDATRFKNVVTMYENMKPKDAAKIFDLLDLKILVEVATQISARRMSDIVAQMSPDAAQRLTVELAARSNTKERAADLPKIEGKPTPN